VGSGQFPAAMFGCLRALLDSERPVKLAVFVEASGDQGLRFADIAARTGWTDDVVSQVAREAMEIRATSEIGDARNATGEAAIVECEGVLISNANFARLSRIALEDVKLHHEREPLSRGLARETLRERHFAHAAPEIFRAAIARLEKEGALVAEKDLIRLSDHGVELSPADAQLSEKIAQVYEKAGLEAPGLDQAFAVAGVSTAQRAHGRKILHLLIHNGTLVRVQGELFFHVQAIAHLKRLLGQYATEHEPERLIDVAQFKHLAGVSRKYAIPLLEYLDTEHITRRAGDKRIIL
jgi:selenocysteine-specific elongation factor